MIIKYNIVWVGVCVCVCVCVCTLISDVRHAKRMRRIASSMACLALQYYSTLSHKRQNFRKQSSGHKMCFWFVLRISFEICLTLRRIQQDFNINLRRSLCDVPVIRARI